MDSNDYYGVVRAVGDLQSDIEKVTDVTPEITEFSQTGVVIGEKPQIITNENIEKAKGIIAVYKNDGTLSSVHFSRDFSDGVFNFNKEITLKPNETVKGMVWSDDEKNDSCYRYI